MKNLLARFPFRLQPFIAGLCVFIVLLFVATIGFGIWSVSLFIAAKYAAGIVVRILSLASLFGILKFQLSQ